MAAGWSPLTAKADTGSIFDGWTGAGCSSTGGRVVSIDAHKNDTASFRVTQK